MRDFPKDNKFTLDIIKFIYGDLLMNTKAKNIRKEVIVRVFENL